MKYSDDQSFIKKRNVFCRYVKKVKKKKSLMHGSWMRRSEEVEWRKIRRALGIC